MSDTPEHDTVLQAELQTGHALALALVEHLACMGATSCIIPVEREGQCYEVRVSTLTKG